MASSLTQQEEQVLKLLGRRFTLAAIARELGIGKRRILQIRKEAPLKECPLFVEAGLTKTRIALRRMRQASKHLPRKRFKELAELPDRALILNCRGIGLGRVDDLRRILRQLGPKDFRTWVNPTRLPRGYS